MTATSLDLSQIKTDALSSAATFRTLIGLGSGDAVTFKEATLTSGTVTSSTPVINATQTWNDGATTFTGALLNITDTASASTSLLMDFQVGGSSKFSVGKSGAVNVATYVSFANLQNGGGIRFGTGVTTGSAGTNQFMIGDSTGATRVFSNVSAIGYFQLDAGQFFGWGAIAGQPYNAGDTRLYRDAANTLAQRNGTNAQTFRLYNTYTSSTSFENLQLQWNSNEARIGTSVGSAGGTQRDIVFGSWDSAGTWNPDLTITPQGVPTFSMGTVTSSQPFTVTQTWNDGATTFTGILANITDTASASASLLMDLQVGGSSKYRVTKSGGIEGVELKTIGASSTSRIFQQGGLGVLSNQTANIAQWTLDEFNSYGRLGLRVATAKTYIDADAADTLAQRNGTNAQTFRLYNTYTSSTSYERGFMRWNSNVFEIGTEAGSGGGTLRGIKLGSATTSLLGFYGVTPVDQPLTVSDPTGGGTVDTEARTAIGEIIDRLQELGLIA